jgi:imidazoleglycerol-phosphate dehydratase
MSDNLRRDRRASLERKTGETTITLAVNLDGDGNCDFRSGVPFLDHMLDALCRHSGLDMDGSCTGDAAMDAHHSVEDVGIILGQCLKACIGDRLGISRFGSAYAPLDEALARVVIDCSGRPFLLFHATMPEPVIGPEFASSLVEEFWRALVINAGMTAHVDLLRARNAHHGAEAIFKAGALALRQATRLVSTRLPSTKGLLA